MTQLKGEPQKEADVSGRISWAVRGGPIRNVDDLRRYSVFVRKDRARPRQAVSVAKEIVTTFCN